jgi:F-box-like
MSVSSISRSNVLGDDVLQMIFQKLEGKDLLSCEAVCRQWRDILLAGTPWRRLFYRQVDCSLLWRKEQKKLEKNQPTLRTERYRDSCRNLLQVERNWQIGKFTKSIYRLGTKDSCRLTMSDDYIAWDTGIGAMFLDTESMKLEEIRAPPGSQHKVQDGALITLQRTTDANAHSYFEISDPSHRYLINVVDVEEEDLSEYLDFYVASMRNQLFALCETTENEDYRFRIWKLGHPSTLLKTFTHKGGPFQGIRKMKLGERFLLIESHLDTLTFVSIEHEASRCFNLNCDSYAYAGELFFNFCDDGIVRVWNAESETYFSDVRWPFPSKNGRDVEFIKKTICVNSKVLVIGWKYRHEEMSYLSVYDLQAIKNINSNPNSHLLYTLGVPLDVQGFVMNESQIICDTVNSGNYNNLIVINFAKLPFKGKSSLRKNHPASKKIEIKIIPGYCVGRGRFSY